MNTVGIYIQIKKYCGALSIIRFLECPKTSSDGNPS